MRDFDATMAGSLYLTHHNSDLEKLFAIGKEIETYNTAQECVERIEYYINHPDSADSIGRAGRLRAEMEHTWDNRFIQLFRRLVFLMKIDHLSSMIGKCKGIICM